MSSFLLHSISYAGLWGQAALSVEEFVHKAAELGFDGIMLAAKRPHASVLDYGSAERAKLRSLLERKSLRNLCVAGYCNLTADLEHSDIPTREIQIHYILELARLTRDLGGSLVRIFTGYENPARDHGWQWKFLADSVKEVCKRSSDLGVTIGVQNHHDLAAGYEALHDLIVAVDEPNCKALFDAWAPALQGADLVSAASHLAPLTVHTTVADYQKRPRYRYDAALVNYRAELPFIQAVPMGCGFIDYKSFFDELRRKGFNGSIAYEMCSPLLHGGNIVTLDRYAVRFLEYMKEIAN